MVRRFIPRVVCANNHVKLNNLRGKCRTCQEPLSFYGDDRPLYGDVSYERAQAFTRWMVVLTIVLMSLFFVSSL
jgi:hypothetical protein